VKYVDDLALTVKKNDVTGMIAKLIEINAKNKILQMKF
jgi:hypothetical protein